MLMINTDYNSFAYGFGKYRVEDLPWNKDEKEEERLKKLGLQDEEKDDDKKNGKMRSKGHADDPNCECETCKNRRYQDGSDEMVSFKSAQKINPAAVAARVRGHEQEHVVNAYDKAAQNNGKVIRASVTLHTAVCPECGRTYVSGGTTNTQIKYYNEENPYQKELKSADRLKYQGMNADYAV